MVMDDKEQKGPQDAARVNVNEEYELDYWSKKFRVSKAAVIRAVSVVGVMAKDVSEFLNGRGTYKD
jgi:hypothetical protein